MYSLQTDRQKRLLTSLNPGIFLGLVFFFILFRTTSEPLFPDALRRWDLLLPVSVYLGQRRGLIEGFILIFLSSHLYSLCSSAPAGLFVILYGFIFLVAKGLLKFIYANNWSSVFGLILSLSFFSRLLLPVIAEAFSHSWPVFTLNNLMIFNVFSNAILGVFIYFILSFVDRLTHKASPAEIQLSEGNL